MRTLVFLVALAVAALAAYRYADRLWPIGAAEPSYQGYFEGEYVYVAAPLSGRLDSLPVRRGDWVKAGQNLFKLDVERETAALNQAEAEHAAAEASLEDLLTGARQPELEALRARLEQIQAEERNSAVQLARDLELYSQGGVSKAQLDRSQALQDANTAQIRQLQNEILAAELPGRDKRIEAAQAQVKAAAAAADQARWAVDRKTAKSLRPGLVVDTICRLGEWVQAGQPVVKLLPPGEVKARFFVPEMDLAGLRIGQEVVIRRDGVDDLGAVINFVSPEAEYTPPVIYSNETRHKLVFMIEATPPADPTLDLHPGQPIMVSKGSRPHD